MDASKIELYKRINASSFFVILGFIFLVAMGGCKKFLDEKPRKSDIIPVTLGDLELLLNNAHNAMNSRTGSGFAELLADNYYLEEGIWQLIASIPVPSLQAEVYNYIWDENAMPFNDGWDLAYQFPIYYSNIVLDQLPLISDGDKKKPRYNSIKGAALFYRAFNFYILAQLYCKPYTIGNHGDPGIVVRLTSDVSVPSTRATLKQTYDQIISDLKEAADLLPLSTTFPTQPTKAAAYAALARTYLTMQEYASAGEFARLGLQLNDQLLDFNNLLPLQTPPIQPGRFNPEIIYYNYSPVPTILSSNFARIDSTLYQSYDDNDLRKTVFYKDNGGVYGFQGSYDGIGPYSDFGVFDGLTTDELYLIRSECLARGGNKDSAMHYLNKLMVKRWKNNGSWIPFVAADEVDALEKVLAERRKELVYRGQRWSDIRRLNEEGANITLKRKIGDAIYTLPPSDKRSVMLIPFDEINRSGIQQNPR